MEKEEFAPRSYQTEIADLAMRKNTIIFLPTGTGKTFIAVLVLKHFFPHVQKPFSLGGKRFVFVVETVVLVDQQALVLEKHLPIKMAGRYFGAMDLDNWDRQMWFTQFVNHEVLVMTAEVFRQILTNGFLLPSDLSVVVFDECHHADGAHPMREAASLIARSKGEKPRLIGLSATLLNANVRSLVEAKRNVVNLLDVFEAVLGCIRDEAVALYATNPIEKVIPCDPETVTAAMEVKRAKKFRSVYYTMHNVSLNSKYGRLLLKVAKDVKSSLTDVEVQVHVLGAYGGSLACVWVIKMFEFSKATETNVAILLQLTQAINAMTATHGKLMAFMGNSPEPTKAYDCSSPKVQTLVHLLTEISKVEDDFRCLILVERRMTAAMLCTVLEHIARLPEYSFISPAYIVGNAGFSDPLPGHAQVCEKKNLQAMKWFASGKVNVLVSTNVAEEGVDIPLCNCVVKFDQILSYRSYVQSKGRARSKESHYYVLEERRGVSRTEGRLGKFREVERYLYNLMRSTETHADSLIVDRDVSEEPLTYEIGNATLRDVGAISILNKYVSMFNCDRYTAHQLQWRIRKVDINGLPIRRRHRGIEFCDEDYHAEGTDVQEECFFIAELSFPQVLRLKSPTIVSEKKRSVRLAKRNAAFQMCVNLHKLGELDDDLVPVSPNARFTPDPSWWPHSNITEKLKEKIKGQSLVTKQKGQLYFSRVPACLTNCSSRPEPKTKLVLHLLNIKTKGDVRPRDEQLNFIYEQLSRNGGYALLTTTEMPKVCRFPVYSRIGELEVKFVPNYEELSLTDEQLNEVDSFMSLLFVEVAPCLLASVFKKANGGKDYLVVPTKTDLGKASIDWDAVRGFLHQPKKPSDEKRLSLQVSEEMYCGTVLTPWYRRHEQSILLFYRIREDLNAFSLFPGLNCSFGDRYLDHHKVETLRPELPLLEVVTLPTSVNGGLRRTRDNTDSRRTDTQHYLPDLVNIAPLSATLWIKAILLPSILCRLERLLIGEELRSKVALEASLGYVKPPSDFEWQPLEAENEFLEERIEIGAGVKAEAEPVAEREPEPKPEPVAEREPEPEPETSGCQREDIDIGTKFWGIDANWQSIDTITEYLHVLQYRPKNSSEIGINSGIKESFYEVVPAVVQIPLIRLVRPSGNPEGVQLNKVMTALTATSANDIVNYERMETLGDSFLKVAVSIFLYKVCPLRSEGQLSYLKDRFIGNRNLYNCALKKKLPESMTTHAMILSKDWCPPKCVASAKQVLRKTYGTTEIGVDDLIVKFSSVSLNEKPYFVCAHELDDLEATRCNGIQVISDKTVADCVEALLGAALLDSGWNGALNMLIWFEIVPKMVKKKISLEEKFESSMVCVKDLLTMKGSNKFDTPTGHVRVVAKEMDTIQSVLRYTFKEPNILRQALTHPTFNPHNNYESLEFIGDAVLDFLITAYIYENCGLLSPGKVTDLRSALVNNITFAALTVKYGLNRFMLMNSSLLMQEVDAFVNFQKESNHKLDSDVVIVCDDTEMKISDHITVPKALADLFEALAGAVFFDSGQDLHTVWKVFYPLMHSVIETFRKDIPINPVRKLYETHTDCKFYFEYNRDERNKRVVATCTVQGACGPQRFHGFGGNRKIAKKAVAKLALHSMNNPKNCVQDSPSA